MNAADLQRELLDYTLAHCGYGEHRGYLGMSQISKCPRRLFFEVKDGSPSDVASNLRCYKGYQEEKDILARVSLVVEGLGAKVIMTDEVRELCASDERFLGHPDGELIALDGSWRMLIEIKSTLQEALDKIIEKARIPIPHWWQVQCYLHFGDWERAFVIYEARDTGQIYVYPVRRDRRWGEQCERKARLVLKALDAGKPPECECGWCRK